MQVIEADVKKGKRKRKIVIALINDEDIKQLKGQMMQGEFDKGMFFLGHQDDEKEILELMRGMND